MSRIRLLVIALVVGAAVLAISSQASAGLFHRHGGDGCCQPTCCAPTTCCAATSAPCCPTSSCCAPAGRTRHHILFGRRHRGNECCTPAYAGMPLPAGTMPPPVAPPPATGTGVKTASAEAPPPPPMMPGAPAPMMASGGCCGCGSTAACCGEGHGRRFRVLHRRSGGSCCN